MLLSWSVLVGGIQALRWGLGNSKLETSSRGGREIGKQNSYSGDKAIKVMTKSKSWTRCCGSM